MSVNIGVLVDEDDTLPHTYKTLNLSIFSSACDGDAVLSYHCFLLAGKIGESKGLIEESEEALDDLEKWARWVGYVNSTMPQRGGEMLQMLLNYG